MEFLDSNWFAALATIILIDLVLAGDNALVIGIAASRLPPAMRRRAILFGSAGAIVIRAGMAMVVVWLLNIPGLLLAGGLLLLPIAWRMGVPAAVDPGAGHEPASTFWGAMRTIVVADALMGIDNVLAIGGAAHGDWTLVVIGLLVTVPLIVWGSGWVSQAVVRWPVVMPAGAALLALTGSSMVVKDPLFDRFVWDNNDADLVLKTTITLLMFGLAWRAARRGPLPTGGH